MKLKKDLKMILVLGNKIEEEFYMNNSILLSIKKMLGIDDSCLVFDLDIIMHINSIFSILNQIGIGPEDGFHINDASSTWDDFMPDLKKDSVRFDLIKTYMYLRVKMLFDPPSVGAVMDSTKNLISEMEWRLKILSEN